MALEKMDIDYSSTVDEKLPIFKSLAESGKIDEAIEKCLSLEKHARTGTDAISTGRLLVCIVEILGDSKSWKKLNENLIIISKKRNQLKQAVTKMVQSAILYIDLTPDESTKLALINTLRTVTEGKIYVEVQRARLTRLLADIKESKGLIDEASNVLQELQVETFGSMEKREKVEFILEQMRLCIAKKDFVQAQILSKKISTKFFQEDGTEDLKLKFYNQMITVDLQNNSFLSISKHYGEIYNTKLVQDDEVSKLKALRNLVIYLILSPYDNEQNDLMHRKLILRDLETLPNYRDMLKLFTTQEILQWEEFCKRHEFTLRTETDAFSTPYADHLFNELQARVTEHNIRVIAAYYTQITLPRLAELLNLDLEEAEKYLSNLVVKQIVSAKIDRLESVVRFTEKKLATDILNDWSYNINSLMSLINQATHLINKERMVHSV